MSEETRDKLPTTSDADARDADARDAAPQDNPPPVREETAPAKLDADAMAWFGDGAPIPDDFVDDSLVELGETDRVGQLAVLLLVAAFAAFLGTQYLSELRYAFTPAEAELLNAGADDPLKVGPAFYSEAGALTLPTNRHAQVQGIMERRSVSDDRIFHKLVGAHVYVELERVDDRPRILQGQPMPVERGTESVRGIYEGTGRLLAFEDLPKRYERLIDFYSEGYQVWFCGFERSDELFAFHQRMESEARYAFRTEHGRDATATELAEELGGRTECQQGYLLQDAKTPASHRVYVGIYAALAVILLGSLALLMRVFGRRES